MADEKENVENSKPKQKAKKKPALKLPPVPKKLAVCFLHDSGSLSVENFTFSATEKCHILDPELAQGLVSRYPDHLKIATPEEVKEQYGVK